MKSRRFSMSSIWKCSHPLCIAHPRSARAIFCRCVQRPLWIFILTLYAPFPSSSYLPPSSLLYKQGAYKN
jgi:hypothetical protein